MEKNLIEEQLEMISKLLKQANSKEDMLVLLGMKEALNPLRYYLTLIQLKGGEIK